MHLVRDKVQAAQRGEGPEGGIEGPVCSRGAISFGTISRRAEKGELGEVGEWDREDTWWELPPGVLGEDESEEGTKVLDGCRKY